MQSKLIVALGNPGTEYDNTRHNIGFAVLNAFSEKYRIKRKQEDKLQSWYGKGNVSITDKNYDLILAWPTTFMNHSGDSVVKLINWFKLTQNNLIVVHDDVALNLGRVKISYDSGAAGHHGVESIIQLLGGKQDFIRLRVGIGPDPGGDVRSSYVLRKFSSEETNLVKKIIKLSIEALETIITKDTDEAMNKFNGIEITT